jgi:hypothetical protein
MALNSILIGNLSKLSFFYRGFSPDFLIRISSLYHFISAGRRSPDRTTLLQFIENGKYQTVLYFEARLVLSDHFDLRLTVFFLLSEMGSGEVQNQKDSDRRDRNADDNDSRDSLPFVGP